MVIGLYCSTIIDVYLVWSESATKNRAEQILLDRLIAAIDETPIEQRSYS